MSDRDAPGRLGAVLQVARELQRAVTVREVEDAYLLGVRRLVPADGYGMYILDPANLEPLDVAATVPESFLEHYEREGRRDDPVFAGAVASRRPVDSSRLPDGVSWQGSAGLSVLERAGYYHSMEAPIVIAGRVEGSLAMVRQHGAAPFSEHDLTCMARVADQVAVALVRARQHQHTVERAALLAAALNCLPQPIVITSPEGALVFRNRVASRPLVGTSTTCIQRAWPVIQESLRRLAQGPDSIATAVESTAGGTQDSVVVESVTLGAGGGALSLISRRARAVGLPGRASLQLTPREQTVADLVGDGLTNRQIAGRLFVSENTVKQHLKRLFAKLEVHSRAELVQAIWAAWAPTAEE